MHRTSGLIVVVVLLALFLIVGSAELLADRDRGPDTIEIGALSPLTGPFGTWGELVTNGFELGIKHLNRAGAPLGRDVNLLIKDTKTDPNAAAIAARSLVDAHGVPAVLGPLATNTAVAIAEGVTIPHQVVQVSICSGIPYSELDDDDYAFRTRVSDRVQGELLGELAWNVGYETLGVLYVKNQYGEGLAEVSREAFEERGGEVLNEVSFAGNRSVYRGELKAVIQDDPDAVLVIGFAENVVAIVRQSLKAELIDNFLFGDPMYGQDIIDQAGGSRLDGTYGLMATGAYDNPALSTFMEAYREEYDQEPKGSIIANSYDAAVVLGLALHRAGKPDPERIRDSLREVANPPGKQIYAGVSEINKAFRLLDEGEEIDYFGASGPLDFDNRGEVISKMQVYKVENGELVYEKTLNREARN
ncbi:MAG: ABC transporter substrate-binding protein [Candidatus Acetothermia bacterium]